MARARRLVLLLVLFAGAGRALPLHPAPPTSLVLTGIVTTNDVIVSPQIAGPDCAAAGEGRRPGQEGSAARRDCAGRAARPTPPTTRRTRPGCPSQVRESRGVPAVPAPADHRSDRPGGIDARLDRGPGRRRGAPISRTPGSPTTRTAGTGASAAWPRSRSSTRRAPPSRRPRPSSTRSSARSRPSAPPWRSPAPTPNRSSARRSQVETNQHMQAAAAAQRTKADVRLRYTRDHCADRRHRRRARRARGRIRRRRASRSSR